MKHKAPRARASFLALLLALPIGCSAGTVPAQQAGTAPPSTPSPPAEPPEHEHDTSDHEHDEHCDHPHHHVHDDDVKSFVFRADKAFNPAKLEDFLGAIVQVYGPKMLRYKGVLHMKGSDRKVIFQGVPQLMGSV